MIRVAQVIWSGNFGGIEKLAFDLCAAQKRNSAIEAELIIGKREGPYIDKVSALKIPFHFADLKSGFDFSFSKFKMLKNIFKKFDIIHLHFFNPVIAYAAVASGKKIVYTEHGNFGFGRKKKMSDRFNYFFLKKFLNKHVSYVSFNSEFTAKIARKRYGLTNTKSKVVYNGIEISKKNSSKEVDPQLKNKLEGKFIVGTSSRFAGFKRIDRLISAFAEFHKDKNALLLLVGEGVMRKELEQLCFKLKVADKTIFTGYRKEVRSLQDAMDVCVFPSENEPFGLVAIEALALGKPVIVFSDGGGIAETVSKISPADVIDNEDALVTRLNYYFNHRDEIENAKEQRMAFAAKFDIRIMEEKFFEIYKEIS